MGKSYKIIIGADFQEKIVKRFMMKVSKRLDILTWSITDFSVKTDGRFQKISKIFQSMIQEKNVHIRIIFGNTRDIQTVQTRFLPIGIQARVLEENHSKLVIMDDMLAYLGSGNFTGSGLGSDYDKTHYNLEVSILLLEREDIRLLRDYFNVLWGYARPL